MKSEEQSEFVNRVNERMNDLRKRSFTPEQLLVENLNANKEDLKILAMWIEKNVSESMQWGIAIGYELALEENKKPPSEN